MNLSCTPFSLITVSGKDAEKFLQGQLTCDVTRLNPGQVIPGAQCTAKGRVIHNFFIGQRDDQSYLLQVPSSMLDVAIASLKKYAVFFKVTIDTETQFKVVHSETASAPAQNSTEITFFATPTLRVSWQDGTLHNASTAPSDTFIQSTYIRGGVAWITPSTSEVFTPEEIDLTDLGAVSFKKGCYTGQEIVARMHYKGAHKRGLGVFSYPPSITVKATDTSIAVEDNIDKRDAISFDQKPVGNLINCVEHAGAQWLLASLPRDLSQSQELTFMEIALTPHPLQPFVYAQ